MVLEAIIRREEEEVDDLDALHCVFSFWSTTFFCFFCFFNLNSLRWDNDVRSNDQSDDALRRFLLIFHFRIWSLLSQFYFRFPQLRFPEREKSSIA